MSRPLRLAATVLSALLSAALPGAAAAGESFAGNWDSPLGKVRIDQDRDSLVGKLLEPSRACGFAKGQEILRGKVVDEVFTGEVRVCFAASCPDKDGWVFAMAASLEAGKLVGALAPGRCSSLVKEKPFLFARARAESAAEAPEPVVAKAKKPAPMSPEVQRLYREGMAFTQAGRFEEARRRFLSANQLDPKNSEIFNQIGITFFARSDYPQAELYYRRSLAADGGNSLAWYNLACVLAKVSKTKEAIKALRGAVDSGFGMVSTLDEDHDLDSLREDPAYQEIRAHARRNAARGEK